MLYLVSQEPKHKYRDAMYSCVAVIEANSAREAIKIAEASGPDGFGQCRDYNKTKAEPLINGNVYRF